MRWERDGVERASSKRSEEERSEWQRSDRNEGECPGERDEMGQNSECARQSKNACGVRCDSETKNVASVRKSQIREGLRLSQRRATNHKVGSDSAASSRLFRDIQWSQLYASGAREEQTASSSESWARDERQRLV